MPVQAAIEHPKTKIEQGCKQLKIVKKIGITYALF